MEKKKQQRKIKRLKEKIKRKEFEMKKQEEDEKQRFLSLSDREKVCALLYDTIRFYCLVNKYNFASFVGNCLIFSSSVLQRAFAAEKRMLSQGHTVILRCFQCAVDMTGQVPFEYNANCFCSMSCLKEHRLHSKLVI